VRPRCNRSAGQNGCSGNVNGSEGSHVKRGSVVLRRPWSRLQGDPDGLRRSGDSQSADFLRRVQLHLAGKN
jgi:hypothetical protein